MLIKHIEIQEMAFKYVLPNISAAKQLFRIQKGLEKGAERWQKICKEGKGQKVPAQEQRWHNLPGH